MSFPRKWKSTNKIDFLPNYSELGNDMVLGSLITTLNRNFAIHAKTKIIYC